jgi:hypothetical protein
MLTCPGNMFIANILKCKKLYTANHAEKNWITNRRIQYSTFGSILFISTFYSPRCTHCKSVEAPGGQKMCIYSAADRKRAFLDSNTLH